MATILVMNASGKYTPKINRNTDVLGIRKAARRDIILQTNASVVLLQESELNIDSFLPRTGRFPKFACLGSKQSGILFRTHVFELSGCASLRREISNLCDELIKTNILKTDHEVMSRLCFGQLQMLSNDLRFLFISWSGSDHSDIEQRKITLKDMLTLIDMFIVGKPVYTLIGGEFNLRYEDVLHVVGEFNSFYLCECSKEHQYPNKTSHFIISQPVSVMIGDVHLIETKPFLQSKYGVPKSDLKHILSHDPVFLNLHL